jgi:hypothetical protein
MKENNDLILEQLKLNGNTALTVQQNNSTNEPTDIYQTWTWGGRIHYVPESFKFPSCTVKSLWDFWFFGMEVPERIRPFRFFKNFEMNRSSCKQNLKKARILMNALISSNSSTLQLQDIINLPYPESQVLFQSSFEKICLEIKDARSEETEGNTSRRVNSRFSQLKWITLFNEISKYRICSKK